MDQLIKKRLDITARNAKDKFCALSERFLRRAKALMVESKDQWALADRQVSEGQRIKKDILAALDPLVAELHQEHKNAVAFRKELLSPIEEAAECLVVKMRAYKESFDQEQEDRKCRLLTSIIDGETDFKEAVLVNDNLRSKTGFYEDFEIGIKDIEKVPYKFLNIKLNKKAIRDYVRGKDLSEVVIDGLEIVPVTKVRRNQGRA